jgi:hypothetical protein
MLAEKQSAKLAWPLVFAEQQSSAPASAHATALNPVGGGFGASIMA